VAAAGGGEPAPAAAGLQPPAEGGSPGQRWVPLAGGDPRAGVGPRGRDGSPCGAGSPGVGWVPQRGWVPRGGVGPLSLMGCWGDARGIAVLVKPGAERWLSAPGDGGVCAGVVGSALAKSEVCAWRGLGGSVGLCWRLVLAVVAPVPGSGDSGVCGVPGHSGVCAGDAGAGGTRGRAGCLCWLRAGSVPGERVWGLEGAVQGLVWDLGWARGRAGALPGAHPEDAAASKRGHSGTGLLW